MSLKILLCMLGYIFQCASTNSSHEPNNESNQKYLKPPLSLAKIDPKIFGGTAVSIKSAPWQVSVRLKVYEDIQYGYGHICGGSVISRRLIVSAAHCVLRTDVTPSVYRHPSEFTLVMGSIHLYEVTPFTLQFNVLKIVANPNIKQNPLQNDIALFFIDGIIPINYPTVMPILLTQLELYVDMNCTVTGWGITKSGITWPVLLGFNVPIVDSVHCNASYEGSIRSGMICAGYTSGGRDIDVCQGDSGGPLICNKRLAGIISWNKGCIESGYSGVYTKISEYRNWIYSTNSSFDHNRYGNAAGSSVKQYRLVCIIFYLMILFFTI